ncbi:MAG: C4-type zinc ribbon domain-containing protein [Nitrospirota bacterium]|mgnify:CR=1 FL=1
MIPVEEKTKRVAEELNLLIGLQELDTKLFGLKNKKAEIPRKIDLLQSSLGKEKDKLEEGKSVQERLKRVKKEKETALDDSLERLRKMKSRATEIKTNKEYQAHLKEIETAQAENRGIEDEILSIMEKMEDSNRSVEAEERIYAEAGRRFEDERKRYEEEEKGFEAEIGKLKDQRETLASKIIKEQYDSYLKILTSGKGIAVVPIKDSSCAGCHMSLPPQVINDVRKNEEIIECSNCHRILYYEGH